ncbi:hypothetical protein BGX38DRAFT_363519 [Terfezia claveryi]|nr:hypothetical protein BGX38DRAFT_363519 [Terfezia claveryi]
MSSPSTPTRTFWCVMYGTNHLGHAFPVDCPLGKTIHELKKRIKTKLPSLLGNVDTPAILLYSFQGSSSDMVVNYTFGHQLPLSAKRVVEENFPPSNEICDLIVVLPRDNKVLSGGSTGNDVGGEVAKLGTDQILVSRGDIEDQSKLPKLFNTKTLRYQGTHKYLFSPV